MSNKSFNEIRLEKAIKENRKWGVIGAIIFLPLFAYTAWANFNTGRLDNILICGIPLLIIGILGLVLFFRSEKVAKWSLAPNVKGHGNAQELLAQMDAEMADSHWSIRPNMESEYEFHITKSWLILIQDNTVAVWLDDIVWVYKIKLTTTSTDGRAGYVQNGIYFYVKNNEKSSIMSFWGDGYQQRIDETFEQLRKCIPWATFGHTDYLEKSWKENNKAFASEVESRKLEMNKSN